MNPQPIATEPEASAQRRLKCFDDTHQEMIEAAVRLISEKGLDSLSIACLFIHI